MAYNKRDSFISFLVGCFPEISSRCIITARKQVNTLDFPAFSVGLPDYLRNLCSYLPLTSFLFRATLFDETLKSVQWYTKNIFEESYANIRLLKSQ